MVPQEEALQKEENLETPCTIEMATSVADQKKVANRDKITASNNLHTEYIIY